MTNLLIAWTACLAAMAAAAAAPPAPTAPPDAPAPADIACRFVIIDRDTPGYRGAVTVNGSQVLVFNGREEGSDTLAAPLKDGSNTIVVAFDHIEGETPAEDDDPFVDLYLSPDRDIPENAPALAYLEADDAAARLECTVEVTDGRAGRLGQVERHWADAARTQLVLEFVADGRAGAKDYDHARRREWDEAGVLILDARFEGPRTTHAVYYKPDGTLGAEIKDGDGWYREWHPGGTLSVETPYRDGFAEGRSRTWLESGALWVQQTYAGDELNGPYKEYYENGKVRLEGTYRHGRQDGLWRISGANGRLLFRREFKDGKPVVPPARVLRDTRLGFSLTVPEGFLEFPGGKATRDIIHAFIAFDPKDEDTSLVLAIERMRGTLGPEALPKDALTNVMRSAIKDAMRRQVAQIVGQDVDVGDPTIETYRDRWKSFAVSGILCRVDAADTAIVTRVVQIPLRHEAIQVLVSGPAAREQDVERTMKAVLASLEGEGGHGGPSRWLGRRLDWVERVAGIAKAVATLAGLVVLIVCLARRKKPAAAPPVPPAPLPPQPPA